MKTRFFFRLAVSLLIVVRISATEYFSGAGAGAVDLSDPPARVYETPWVNELTARIQSAPRVSSQAKAEAIELVSQLSVIASSRSAVGQFDRTVGDAHGTVVITLVPDNLVSPFHVTGSGFLVDLWLAVPSVAPNRAPGVVWDSAPSTVASEEDYLVSATADDPDRNLTEIRIWKDGQPFASSTAGDGGRRTVEKPTTDQGPRTITFTAQAVDASGATSPLITHSVVVAAPTPVNHAPTISWRSSPGAIEHQGSYTVAARGEDADGNLAKVTLWKNGVQFALEDGGPGDRVDVGNSSRDAGPQVITFTAQAVDASGVASPIIFLEVAIGPPAPDEYTLSTAANEGGRISEGGTYPGGTIAWVTATPDAIHDFTGWNGDVSGRINPLGIMMDGSKSVQAVFALKTYPLVTAATEGGAVTAGGTYPHGTTITVTASAADNYRFVGWDGDASGSERSVAVFMSAAKSVQAFFVPKSAQSIVFPPLADQNLGASPIALSATASSGLPVTYAVVSGPASISGNQLMIGGAGAIVVEARQSGDAIYLPAPTVTRAFNAVASATVKYQPRTRLILQHDATRGGATYVIERP